MLLLGLCLFSTSLAEAKWGDPFFLGLVNKKVQRFEKVTETKYVAVDQLYYIILKSGAVYVNTLDGFTAVHKPPAFEVLNPKTLKPIQPSLNWDKVEAELQLIWQEQQNARPDIDLKTDVREYPQK